MLLKKYKILTPKDCLNMTFEQSLLCLKDIISQESYERIFNKKEDIKSPLSDKKDTIWCKTSKMVGINPKICKTLWGIVKYSMSFPENAIHIMPLWETGDKGSLYVQNSWKLNDEFFDEDLEKLGFKTIEEQLKLVINVLHSLGKTVGFDVLPHVDNFSEIVILNPKLFEWVKLNKEKTAQLFPPQIDYNLIYKEVENLIIKCVGAPDNLFESDEAQREKIIFSSNKEERLNQRIKIMKTLQENGFSPLPVVEHAPSRPVVFKKIQSDGENSWFVFDVENKSQEAKIIGCVTPYKWYQIDEKGFPKKNAVQNETWQYFVNKIYEFQKEYNFDFLRADMAHIQHSHSHSDNKKDLFNQKELWAVVKNKISAEKPYFATFAEAFYGNYYINGIQDMMNKNFDMVLGYLNYKYLNDEYIEFIKKYLTEYAKYSFYPCVCTYSNDGDLPVHNKYFQSPTANAVRFFISLFINLPSYMGMGFETRNLLPKDECEFSNEFVKYQPFEYKFGENYETFECISQMREVYNHFQNLITNGDFKLLNTDYSKSLCWCYSNDDGQRVLFVINLGVEKNSFTISDFEFELTDDISLIYTNAQENDYSLTVIDNKLTVNNFEIGNSAIFVL